MKHVRLAVALLTLFASGGTLVYAQKPSPKSSATVTTPDLSKLNIGSILEQMQTASAPADSEAPTPIEVVVQFLQLTPTQQQQFGQLLQARQAAVAPLLVGIQQRVQQLEALLSSGGNPAEVGALVIQIHALQQQVVQIQQAFLANLANLLDAEQQQRLQAVRISAQLQPVLPAFQALSLL